MIVCADDFAMSFATSQVIVELIERSRLTATTCLVTSQDCEKSLNLLKPLQTQVDIGLHLALTLERPVTPLTIDSNLIGRDGRFLTLPRLLVNLALQRVDFGALEQELRGQMQRFQQILGRSPDFIDGHQHIHQLPIVREIVSKLAVEIQSIQPFYLRISRIPPEAGGWPGRIAISHPARQLLALAQQNRMAHNRFLWGYHRYTHSDGIKVAMLRARSAGAFDIFFAHPGASHHPRDPLCEVRVHNYQFLASPEFLDFLVKHRISLNRFPHATFGANMN